MRFEMDKETIYLIKLGTKEDGSFISFCLTCLIKLLIPRANYDREGVWGFQPFLCIDSKQM